MARKKKKSMSRGETPARTRELGKSELTRYRSFAEAYLAVGQHTYLNPQRSGIVAGYTEGTAKTMCYRLLQRPVIQEMMREIRDARMASSTIASPEEVLETLTSQMRGLPDKFVDKEGNFVPLHKLDVDALNMISGVKIRSVVTETKDGPVTVTTYDYEYKKADKVKIAELLSKHHGLFEKDNRQQKQVVAQTNLVLMPSGDLSISDWSKQADIILNDKQKALPAPQANEIKDDEIIDILPQDVDDLDFLRIDEKE